MKKLLFGVIVLFFIGINLYAQSDSSEDLELKNKLVQENPFGNFLRFNDDNTFSSNYRTWGGDGYAVEGLYDITDGIISFSEIQRLDSWEDSCIKTDDNGDLDFTHHFKYLPKEMCFNFYGCLFDVDNKSHFWSINPVPENVDFEINGVKVNRVNNKILLFKQNASMREETSFSGRGVSIDGCDFDFGFTEDRRSVIFAGTVVKPLAKTVKREKINGVTAPWYYIEQKSHDPLWRGEGEIFYVWIFGGYVTEYPENQYNNIYKSAKIIEAIEKLGMELHKW